MVKIIKSDNFNLEDQTKNDFPVEVNNNQQNSLLESNQMEITCELVDIMKLCHEKFASYL